MGGLGPVRGPERPLSWAPLMGAVRSAQRTAHARPRPLINATMTKAEATGAEAAEPTGAFEPSGAF